MVGLAIFLLIYLSGYFFFIRMMYYMYPSSEVDTGDYLFAAMSWFSVIISLCVLSRDFEYAGARKAFFLPPKKQREGSAETSKFTKTIFLLKDK